MNRLSVPLPLRTVVCPVLILVLALLACGCSAGPSEPAKPENRQMSSAVQKASGVSVTLRATPAVSAVGGTFSLTLNVRNLSGKAMTFDVPSGKMYDFVAYSKGGDEVWRYSEGMFYTQAISPVTIAPEESQVFKVAWNTGSTPTGLYSIQGWFEGLPETRPTVSVEIEP